MQDFTIDKLKDYKMFYVLKNIKSSSDGVVLSHKQTYQNNLVEPEKYDIFKVGEDSVLVAFKNVFEHVGKHNYIASNGTIEENVNLNPYERIVDYYTTDRDDEPSGVFAFCDSQPIILEGQDWRCDNSSYGPRGFYPVGKEKIIVESLNSIKVYEPILNINGLCHVVFIKYDGDDRQIRFEYINDAELPLASETLPEMFKLIIEWYQVADEPFNNTEKVAIVAKEFVQKFGITEDLVVGQPDMNVFKYLKGDTSARLRTNGIYPMSDELNDLIKSSIPYMTFSQLLQIYPGLLNLDECIQEEKLILRDEWDRFLEKFHVEEYKEYGDTDGVYGYISEHFPGNLGFVKNYLTLLMRRDSLLNSL